MSLWPIKTVANIFPYKSYDGRELDPIWEGYNPGLLAPPRAFEESLGQVAHFFYNPGNDRLVAYVTFKQVSWPGWNAERWEWSAETGEFISRTWCGIWAIAYPVHAGVGSYNKIFCTWNTGYTVTEVPWDTLSWASPMWTVNPWSWSPQRIFRYALVNQQDGLVVGVADWNLEVWSLSGTPTKRASMRLPNTLGYLAYENRETCWVVTKDGLILKADYRRDPPRWEMLSSVQNPSPDAVNYFIAWDQKRGRVAILRQRPDADDGACRCQFEFYRPLVKVAGLTDPVPVKRHRAGDLTEFVAHLYGSAGEGISPYHVTASLQNPAAGILLQAESMTSQNGAVSLLYQAPALPGEDTLVLEVTINDGEA